MTAEEPAHTSYRSGVLSKDSPTERARLNSIQSSVDVFSTGILAALGVRPSWDCLELGAGAGSIAYWLAERCPDGRVVAADIDTRYLDADAAANLEIAEQDVTDPGYAPGPFDLVHARYLFSHLPARDEVLARAAGWLKPGGWLVLEEPYQLPAETSPFPVVRRIMAAYRDKYAEHGADLTWARSIPSALAGAGLTEVDFTGRLACMGNLERDRWRPLIAQVSPALIEEGSITQAELDEFTALLDDPAFIDVPQFTLAAWGRRD